MLAVFQFQIRLVFTSIILCSPYHNWTTSSEKVCLYFINLSAWVLKHIPSFSVGSPLVEYSPSSEWDKSLLDLYTIQDSPLLTISTGIDLADCFGTLTVISHCFISWLPNPQYHQQLLLTAYEQMHHSLTMEEESCWGSLSDAVSVVHRMGHKIFLLISSKWEADVWSNTSLIREIVKYYLQQSHRRWNNTCLSMKRFMHI